MVEHEKYERIFSIVVFAGGLFLLDWRDECKIPCLMVDLKKWAFIGIRNAKWYFPARARLEFIFDVGFIRPPGFKMLSYKIWCFFLTRCRRTSFLHLNGDVTIFFMQFMRRVVLAIVEKSSRPSWAAALSQGQAHYMLQGRVCLRPPRLSFKAPANLCSHRPRLCHALWYCLFLLPSSSSDGVLRGIHPAALFLLLLCLTLLSSVLLDTHHFQVFIQ